ncbi:hypothetical protein BJF85_05020 [Saccharomonospora sp. CUA-673]|nr:hypothetical protein BJF85_05020 [Saccharomonospora sp. CUA-673]
MASTTVATIVANSASPRVIMVSMCGPISACPSARVGSGGGAPVRCGQSMRTMPAASTTKVPTDSVMAPALL